jgi:hypothetical protein
VEHGLSRMKTTCEASDEETVRTTANMRTHDQSIPTLDASVHCSKCRVLDLRKLEVLKASVKPSLLSPIEALIVLVLHLID